MPDLIRHPEGFIATDVAGGWIPAFAGMTGFSAVAMTGFKFDNSYARLPGQMFTRIDPVPVTAPSIVLVNHDLAAQMGLDFSDLDRGDLAAILAGNRVPEGAEPLAQAYAGHQFGHFTMLGDGRAIVMGEHICPDYRRVDLQWKGSGRTPYSRNGDGRAALGPMLREYLISEAMAGLGIPTTRSLAVVRTGEHIYRDDILPGAVLMRVAASHIRVGTFEYVAALENINLLRQMAAYTLHRHDPDLIGTENPALALLRVVMARQVALVTAWLRVGFIHGVMNTDNVALSGETIDYGPCAFMDAYDPATVFSAIDRQGRYAFGRQPVIIQWNMARFAEALLPLIHDDLARATEIAEAEIAEFGPIIHDQIDDMHRQKLGLSGAQPDDTGLVMALLDWMRGQGVDYTQCFRDLSQDMLPDRPLYREPEFRDWYQRWQRRLDRNPVAPHEARAAMRNINPAVIPRNYRVEEVLAAAHHGDLSLCHRMVSACKNPYDDAVDDWLDPPLAGQACYQTFCGT